MHCRRYGRIAGHERAFAARAYLSVLRVIKHWRACRRRRCPPGRSPRNAVIFGAACRSCPLRQRCTTAKHGRTLHLHEHEGLLRAARAEWAGLRRDYMTPRPQVGRAIAQMATSRGRRLMLRYREVTSNNAWLKRRTAAVNLRSLLGRGLTRRDGVWALATCPGCHRQARHHGQPGKKTTARRQAVTAGARQRPGPVCHRRTAAHQLITTTPGTQPNSAGS